MTADEVHQTLDLGLECQKPLAPVRDEGHSGDHSEEA